MMNRFRKISTLSTLGLIFTLVIALGACDEDNPAITECSRTGDLGPNYGISVPAWNHSGSVISYQRLLDSALEFVSGYYQITSDGVHQGIFEVAGSRHRWFPGDTEFVYNPGGALGGELLIYNVNTAEIRGSGIEIYAAPFDLSADGAKLYFAKKSLNGIWSTTLFEMDLHDSTERELKDGAFPAVSPDSKFLAFHRNGVFVLNLTTLIEEKILDYGNPVGWNSNSLSVVVSGAIKPGSGSRIVVVDLNGRRVKDLCDGLTQSHVSRLNKIVFMRGRSDLAKDLWIMDIEGNGVRRLVP